MIKSYIKTILTNPFRVEEEVKTDGEFITIDCGFWSLQLSKYDGSFLLSTDEECAISNYDFEQIKEIIDHHEVIKQLWREQSNH